MEGSAKEREASEVLLRTSCLERESDLSRYCQCCQLVLSVLDKACVGESTQPDNVVNSIVQKYKLKRNFKDDIDLNSFILNLIHTIISFTTTDLRYLSIWIGEHFVRTSRKLDLSQKGQNEDHATAGF